MIVLAEWRDEGDAMSSERSSSQPADPYANFKFRLKWGGKYVAGLSKISALRRAQSADQTKFDPITLERGLTQDVEFEAWIRQVWNFRAAAGTDEPFTPVCRDIVIDFYNEAGQLVQAYTIYRCWPSEYTALPELDGSANAVAIQTLVLQNEGWERDPDVKLAPLPDFS